MLPQHANWERLVYNEFTRIRETVCTKDLSGRVCLHEENGTSLALQEWVSIRQMEKRRKVGSQKWPRGEKKKWPRSGHLLNENLIIQCLYSEWTGALSTWQMPVQRLLKLQSASPLFILGYLGSSPSYLVLDKILAAGSIYQTCPIVSVYVVLGARGLGKEELRFKWNFSSAFRLGTTFQMNAQHWRAPEVKMNGTYKQEQQ